MPDVLNFAAVHAPLAFLGRDALPVLPYTELAGGFAVGLDLDLLALARKPHHKLGRRGWGRGGVGVGRTNPALALVPDAVGPVVLLYAFLLRPAVHLADVLALFALLVVLTELLGDLLADLLVLVRFRYVAGVRGFSLDGRHCGRRRNGDAPIIVFRVVAYALLRQSLALLGPFRLSVFRDELGANVLAAHGSTGADG